MTGLPNLPPPLPGRALPRLPEPRTAPDDAALTSHDGAPLLDPAPGSRHVGHHIADAVSEAQAEAEEADEAFGPREVLRAVAHGVARAGRVVVDPDELHRVADEMAGAG